MDKQKSSLFVGRWQPLGQGHKALMETVLKEGKPILVAIETRKLIIKIRFLLLNDGQ